jgi:hypothetical protein
LSRTVAPLIATKNSMHTTVFGLHYISSINTRKTITVLSHIYKNVEWTAEEAATTEAFVIRQSKAQEIAPCGSGLLEYCHGDDLPVVRGD